MPAIAARSRLRILILLGIVIAIGVWSRTPGGHFPLQYKAVGDVLWATMFYLLVLAIRPQLSVATVAIITLVITFAIEFLKLYHAPWIDALRAHRISGFLLGHRFYWHDLAAYAIGSSIGTITDLTTRRAR